MRLPLQLKLTQQLLYQSQVPYETSWLLQVLPQVADKFAEVLAVAQVVVLAEPAVAQAALAVMLAVQAVALAEPAVMLAVALAVLLQLLPDLLFHSMGRILRLL